MPKEDRQANDPTLAEIQRMCEAIQKDWSPRVRRTRAGLTEDRHVQPGCFRWSSAAEFFVPVEMPEIAGEDDDT